MKSGFLSDLCLRLKPGTDNIWILDHTLIYQSAIIGQVCVLDGFETDLASVRRVPVVYNLWGNRAHREAVLHDYLYRSDSVPAVTKEQADSVFLEAMKSRGVAWWIRYPMYAGVMLGGGSSYHKLFVNAQLF